MRPLPATVRRPRRPAAARPHPHGWVSGPAGGGGWGGRVGGGVGASTFCPAPRREAMPVRDVRQGLHPGQLPHRPRAPAHWGEALRLRALRQEVLPRPSHPCSGRRGVPALHPLQGARKQMRVLWGPGPTAARAQAVGPGVPFSLGDGAGGLTQLPPGPSLGRSLRAPLPVALQIRPVQPTGQSHSPP